MFSLDDKLILKLLNKTLPSFQVTDRTSHNLGFGFIFYAFTRVIRPRNVVVIGSKAGFAPVLFALALKDNEGYNIDIVNCDETILQSKNSPVLHFIDPSYSIENNDKNHWFGIGTWNDPKNVENIWKEYGVEDIITHYKLTSMEYLKRPDKLKSIDILYVDGDHSYKGIMQDFNEFYKYLNNGAIVIAHDVDPKLKEDFKATDTLDIAGGYDAFMDVSDEIYEKFRLPIYPGLAIMRKK